MKITALLAVLLLVGASQAKKPPFTYVWGDAVHIDPATTSEESGYFSLCEGRDGRMYVGTAKYGVNAFLVEVEPRTLAQRTVLDTHKVCGLEARGYAAQAKLHTRNFVAPSGRIYVGSKQGYRKEGDTSEYPGGYVMVHDPAAGTNENLGMPLKGQGIIDVVADEARGLLYAVTCEKQHWMIGDLKTRTYRELGPLLTPYATTLIDGRGGANAITADFRLARHDPETGKTTVSDIHVDGERWTRPNENSIPTWNLAADGRIAWLILMNDARLIRIDLEHPDQGKRVGLMLEGKKPDSRSSLSVAPDGRVYAVIRVVNATGFGEGFLHHLTRYDPRTRKMEDLGVLAVRNPDYYDFAAKRKWGHGFHRLPDGTLTPLYSHMGLIMGRDGKAWVTILYPYTLLRIDPEPKRVAAIVTAYYRNSHADVIVSRLLETDTLDGKGRRPALKLVSLYTDQKVRNRPDIGQGLARKHGVRISPTVKDALTLGTDRLAVDGVLLVAEHGRYPRSSVGQIRYPKRRLFGKVVDVFRKSGRTVPVYVDKHLSDTWKDAKWLYDTAQEMKIPIMAGSSIPVLWRDPPVVPARGARLKEVVALSYGPLDAYGFHALEMLQAVVERRKGGETGLKAVRCLEGNAVWNSKLYDRKLLGEAIRRHPDAPGLDERFRNRDVTNPVLFHLEYADGLKASVLTLKGAVHRWTIAWRDEEGKTASTRLITQEARPFMHFTYLVEGITSMMHTGRPAWPAERTLLTSGALHALHVSKSRGGERLETPELTFPYRVDWVWRQPPPSVDSFPQRQGK